MTQSLNPQHMVPDLPSNEMRVALSVHKTINGGIDQAIPTATEPSSAGINTGVYSKFEQGNMKNQFVRVAAHGVAVTNAPYTWGATGAGVVINHTLGRLPIGFKIADKDKTVDVYRTAAPTETTITVAPTDNTASVTLEIF